MLCRITVSLFLFDCRQTIDRGLDVHQSRKAIVVHYALEAVVTNEYGDPVVADSKECLKV